MDRIYLDRWSKRHEEHINFQKAKSAARQLKRGALTPFGIFNQDRCGQPRVHCGLNRTRKKHICSTCIFLDRFIRMNLSHRLWQDFWLIYHLGISIFIDFLRHPFLQFQWSRAPIFRRQPLPSGLRWRSCDCEFRWYPCREFCTSMGLAPRVAMRIHISLVDGELICCYLCELSTI